MCIAVFLWQSHPLYPFLLFLNRDEYLNRATEALRWWQDGETLGGRDLVGGGTWLGCNRHGRIAFLTNFRETSSIPDAKSRGDLPLRYLQSQKSPAEFAEEIEKEASLYNGFNLVVAHVFSKSMFYVTNRPLSQQQLVTLVSPGIHVLSNANLDSPWPKCLRLRDGFNQLLTQHPGGEFPVKTMVEEVMTDTVKDQEPDLPHVFPPDTEYHLSSIFVDVPRPAGRYGTRSISALTIKSHGQVCFYERHLEPGGGSWKELTQHFVIQNQTST
ncbi:unnamed protein product [Brassica oleracea var. botrytis]|uniref:Transport and Golgi organization 2 homolog n=4 Tax=Brassica TaxID=3705 RepID=A0ABQ7YVE2_BRANA|nr:PREDICTED: transport and Golgi organization 2 homolog [Brassica oleracea var. oleracea]XP_013729573.1 transport and Golgi organization 2 homolog [Brassica napus]KAF3596334.1 hypothetical protein DY000_02028225 [Brassica cretica]VDD41232.1 unnamed protein product [Brassica oleracea]KAH0871887.1 hypothetical protein HID58_078909 [Brassica napus]CDY59096.1 BnaCnng34210D [Brassica napus]